MMQRWWITAARALREWFLLERARAFCERAALPAERRIALQEALEAGRQKMRAADALRLERCAAEGLRLARAAVETDVEAATEVLATIPAGASDAEDYHFGMVRARCAETREAMDAVAAPRLERDVSREHHRLIARLRRAHGRLDASLAPLACGAKGLVATRRVRLALAAAALVVVLASVWLLIGHLRAPRAEASAVLNADYSAGQAIDDDATTEWALPNGQAGSLTVRFSSSRPLSKVRLLNSRNRPWNDRGTKDFQLVALRDGVVVASASGTFTEFPDDRWLVLPLGPAEIDAVRFDVLSWHGLSGGLAELVVE